MNWRGVNGASPANPARYPRSHAAKMTPKSRTRRLAVPRPRATPYTERARRCGSEVVLAPSLSGAVESRPTPVTPRPTAQPGHKPGPSGPPTDLGAGCAKNQPRERAARGPGVPWEDSDIVA